MKLRSLTWPSMSVLACAAQGTLSGPSDAFVVKLAPAP